jgi:DNA polymerase-3 subunit delta
MSTRSGRGPKAEDVLGHVTLVTGKEEFLNERTVVAVREAVRRYDAEAELSETLASGLTLAALGELAAPSLFSSTRCVVVRALEALPDESAEGLVAYAAAPVEDVALVLVHGGGPKGSGLLAKLRKLGGVTEVKSVELRASDFPGFVTEVVRHHGSSIDRDAAAFLVAAVGQDLRSLAAAAEQLTSDFPGEPLTTE